MDPRHVYIDDRLKGNCAYCGGWADSRDHIPSKVLLDRPYPENLPVIGACEECNSGFSADEEYVSCLIECVIQGTTDPDDRFREKIASTLKSRPAIAERIKKGRQIGKNNEPVWMPEWKRIEKVVLKLARGHMSYELGVQHVEKPKILNILPFPTMTQIEIEQFNMPIESERFLLPEIGSRAFINLMTGKPTAYCNWNVVQDGRYRYTIGQTAGDWVKFVLSEYLACFVAWD